MNWGKGPANKQTNKKKKHSLIPKYSMFAKSIISNKILHSEQVKYYKQILFIIFKFIILFNIEHGQNEESS